MELLYMNLIEPVLAISIYKNRNRDATTDLQRIPRMNYGHRTASLQYNLI